jgi:hypothetical protein
VKDELSRRDLLGRAGLALGGLVTIGGLACSGDEDPRTIVEECPAPADPGPQVISFPYKQFLPAGYQLDVAAVKEAAYHGYYEGGCCHGAYKAILNHLAQTVGQPFSLMPLDFCKFGGGGVAGYGSICGAVLGSQLVINMVVEESKPDPADATKTIALRNPMMTAVMRWYESFAFPAYSPTAVDAKETGLTKDFSQSNLAALQVVPGSHLCHASVTSWCAANGVSASGKDKLARCARLTADVAGEAAELINAYLTSNSVAPIAMKTEDQACGTCHGAATTSKPVAAGMSCTSCHPIATTTPYPHP